MNESKPSKEIELHHPKNIWFGRIWKSALHRCDKQNRKTMLKREFRIVYRENVPLFIFRCNSCQMIGAEVSWLLRKPCMCLLLFYRCCFRRCRCLRRRRHSHVKYPESPESVQNWMFVSISKQFQIKSNQIYYDWTIFDALFVTYLRTFVSVIKHSITKSDRSIEKFMYTFGIVRHNKIKIIGFEWGIWTIVIKCNQTQWTNGYVRRHTYTYTRLQFIIWKQYENDTNQFNKKPTKTAELLNGPEVNTISKRRKRQIQSQFPIVEEEKQGKRKE